MVHPIGPRNLPAAFAGRETLAGFLLLMRVELRLATKSGAALARSSSAFVGTFQDTGAFLLGEA